MDYIVIIMLVLFVLLAIINSKPKRDKKERIDRMISFYSKSNGYTVGKGAMPL